MSKPRDEARALREMVKELRAEAPKEPAWDALEARLFTEMDRREAEGKAPAEAPAPVPSAVAPRRRSQFGRAFALAAAAALVLGGLSAAGAGSGALGRPLKAVVGSLREELFGPARDPFAPQAPAGRVVSPESIALAPGEAGARGERDLLALAPGDVIEAAGAPVTFGQKGVVTWTLTPGSRLVVRSLGERGVGHTVALDHGALRAEVTPRDPSEGIVEAFVVEIGNTRVAVRGTAFSVVRGVDDVIVDVEHGSVAVGPTGQVDVTTGHLLVGPRRASFSLDGGRSARFLPPADAADPKLAAAAPPPRDPKGEPQGEPAAEGVADAKPLALEPPFSAPHAASPKGAPARPAAPPQAKPASGAATLTVGSVRAHLARCFAATYQRGSDAVEVSVASTLNIVLKADGSVQSARFDPPLKPEFQLCAGAAIAGRFAEGGVTLQIPIAMKR